MRKFQGCFALVGGKPRKIFEEILIMITRD